MHVFYFAQKCSGNLEIMGQIRTKTIKGKRYFYYSVRSRSRKKYGGSGKVVSTDYFLGCYGVLSRQWRDEYTFYTIPSSYYLWNGDIDISDFIDAYIRYQFRDWLEEFVWSVNVKRKKISIRSKRGSYFDARWRWVRGYVQYGEQAFEAAPTLEAAIAETVEEPYRNYIDCLSYRDEYQEKAIQYRKQRNFDDAGIYDEAASRSEEWASHSWERYQENLKTLIKNCPRSIRDEFSQKIERRMAKINPSREAA